MSLAEPARTANGETAPPPNNQHPGRTLMRTALLLILTLILSPLPQLGAQESLITDPGDRVRLQLSRQVGERKEPQRLEGEVLAITPDSLTLRIHPGTTPVTVEIASVERLERSLGVPSAAESALRQGAFLGALAAVEFPILDMQDQQFASVGEAALVGAAIGTAAGLIMGALFPRERWERVRLPHGAAPLPEALIFPGVAFGGGWGWGGGAAGSGTGIHAQVGVGLTRLSDDLHLRGELMYQRATASGTPFACKQVERRYCLGREDETRRYGAGLTLVREMSRPGDRVHVYLPLGLGVFHSRIDSKEAQGPTTICVVDGQVTSCPGNPPFATLRDSREATGVMANLGLGISIRLAGINAFAEARAQVIGEQETEPASFAPLTLGVSF